MVKKTPGKCSIPLIKINTQYFIFKKNFFLSFPKMQEKPRGPNLCWACKRSTALLQGRLATCVPWLEIVNTLYASNSLSWKFSPRRLWLMPTDVLVQRCSVFVTCKTWEPAWHQQGYTSWKCLLLKANDWGKCSWHNGMRKAQNKKTMNRGDIWVHRGN